MGNHILRCHTALVRGLHQFSVFPFIVPLEGKGLAERMHPMGGDLQGASRWR